MTFLKVNRLVVLKRGKTVYDESFSKKINIIRGENGSGKSTIINIIYFALGGDFIEWLPEARSCDLVIVEISLNDKIITLKREIADRTMQPMQIYFGNLNAALKNTAGWLFYTYRKSETKDSFSQELFKFLQFPEVTTDNNETITINQILRLLYIDQISPVNTLIKSVDFDSPLIRQAIGNLLFGVYDDKLFNEQLQLREKKKLLSELTKEYNAILGIYKSSNISLDFNAIDNEVSEYQKAIIDIENALSNRDITTDNVKKNEVFNRIKELKEEEEEVTKILVEETRNFSQLETDIIDSEAFIRELQMQNAALNESLNTREILGGLTVNYCPSCLSKIEEIEDDHTCQLCKQHLDLEGHKGRVLRIQHEIQNQLKESEYLLDKKKGRLGDIAAKIVILKKELNVKQQRLNSYAASANVSTDRKYDELLIRKGELGNKIENLLKQRDMLVSFNGIKNRKESAAREIQNLEETISNKEDAQRKKLVSTLSRIQHYALQILKGDGDYESTFVNATSIRIDLSKNLFFVNERNNFSASSLVILKNSIRFGIFFASLELEFMRYPHFILCDNIEDKGMKPARSQNFQKNIVKLAESFKDKDYQIIFSTSMISPELNTPEYTVGEDYTPQNKSLKIDILPSNDNLPSLEMVDDIDPF